MCDLTELRDILDFNAIDSGSRSGDLEARDMVLS